MNIQVEEIYKNLKTELENSYLNKIKNDIQSNVSEFQQSAPENFNLNLREVFKELDFNFEEEKLIEIYFVDYVITKFPQLNKITPVLVEINGPSHYDATEKKFTVPNAKSELKIIHLKELGYNLITFSQDELRNIAIKGKIYHKKLVLEAINKKLSVIL